MLLSQRQKFEEHKLGTHFECVRTFCIPVHQTVLPLETLLHLEAGSVSLFIWGNIMIRNTILICCQYWTDRNNFDQEFIAYFSAYQDSG